jgi:hypothetical protein
VTGRAIVILVTTAGKVGSEAVTEDVPSLLGRPARSFGQFAADYAAAFS